MKLSTITMYAENGQRMVVNETRRAEFEKKGWSTEKPTPKPAGGDGDKDPKKEGSGGDKDPKKEGSGGDKDPKKEGSGGDKQPQTASSSGTKPPSKK